MMSPKPSFAFHRFSSRGFSLLDLQVAIVVLSFGILGLSQSMISSFDQSSDALSRTLAVLESKNLLQRIRTHQSSLGSFGEYYSSVGFQQISVASSSCVNRACSESALADFDVALWHCALAGGNYEYDGCEAFGPLDLNMGQTFSQLPQSRLALIITGGSSSPAEVLAQVRWRGTGAREQALDFGLRR